MELREKRRRKEKEGDRERSIWRSVQWVSVFFTFYVEEMEKIENFEDYFINMFHNYTWIKNEILIFLWVDFLYANIKIVLLIYIHRLYTEY